MECSIKSFTSETKGFEHIGERIKVYFTKTSVADIENGKIAIEEVNEAAQRPKSISEAAQNFIGLSSDLVALERICMRTAYSPYHIQMHAIIPLTEERKLDYWLHRYKRYEDVSYFIRSFGSLLLQFPIYIKAVEVQCNPLRIVDSPIPPPPGPSSTGANFVVAACAFLALEQSVFEHKINSDFGKN